MRTSLDRSSMVLAERLMGGRNREAGSRMREKVTLPATKTLSQTVFGRDTKMPSRPK
jgi:hypothetical protein